MAAWAYLVSTSELRCRRFFFHRLRLDLKTSIKKVPWRFAKGGGGETQNHETERQKAAAGEDRRGETPPESPPEGSTPSGVFIINIYSKNFFTIITMMRGE